MTSPATEAPIGAAQPAVSGSASVLTVVGSGVMIDSASTVQLTAVFSLMACKSGGTDTSMARLVTTPLQLTNGPSAELLGSTVLLLILNGAYGVVFAVVVALIRYRHQAQSNDASHVELGGDDCAADPRQPDVVAEKVFKAKLYLQYARVPVVVTTLLFPGMVLEGGDLMWGAKSWSASAWERVLGCVALLAAMAFIVYHHIAGVFAESNANSLAQYAADRTKYQQSNLDWMDNSSSTTDRGNNFCQKQCNQNRPLNNPQMGAVGKGASHSHNRRESGCLAPITTRTHLTSLSEAGEMDVATPQSMSFSMSRGNPYAVQSDDALQKTARKGSPNSVQYCDDAAMSGGAPVVMGGSFGWGTPRLAGFSVSCTPPLRYILASSSLRGTDSTRGSPQDAGLSFAGISVMSRLPEPKPANEFASLLFASSVEGSTSLRPAGLPRPYPESARRLTPVSGSSGEEVCPPLSLPPVEPHVPRLDLAKAAASMSPASMNQAGDAMCASSSMTPGTGASLKSKVISSLSTVRSVLVNTVVLSTAESPSEPVWYVWYTAEERRRYPRVVRATLLATGFWTPTVARSWYCVVTATRPSVTPWMAPHNLWRMFLVSCVASIKPPSSADCKYVQGAMAAICFLHAVSLLVTFAFRIPALNVLQALQSALLGLLACTPFIPDTSVPTGFSNTLMALSLATVCMSVAAVVLELFLQRPQLIAQTPTA